VRVTGDRISDDGDVVPRRAIGGAGIAYKSRLDVADEFASGRLRIVCADWQGEPAPAYVSTGALCQAVSGTGLTILAVSVDELHPEGNSPIVGLRSRGRVVTVRHRPRVGTTQIWAT
jgi:hypothetical protein